LGFAAESGLFFLAAPLLSLKVTAARFVGV
jgi:hypothetical protein